MGMVRVQFVVRVPDVERFVATAKRFEQANVDRGARNPRVLIDENDPNLVCMMADWESHEAMHAASEELGPDFNREAGTEGLDWTTYVWHER
ncbi:MAG TPA: hypothetical protein VNP94_14110 [Actinomycetota bacterium]|nr:hypothetical protein [Actinomycetota bacterium]